MILPKLPNSPGCYLFKDNNDNVIYVGKAKNLKKRITSYFTKKHDVLKTNILISNIESVDFFITDNEIEALILENNLIKKYYPKYNVNLKDSKRYAYLKLTDEKYPRLILTRKRNAKGEYFGPFVSGRDRELIYETVVKTFKLRTCKKLPKKECLRFHIGLCSAPCIMQNYDEYNVDVNFARSVLKGNVKKIRNEMNTQMVKLSNNQEYEQAMLIRNRISSLDYLIKKQKTERMPRYDEDIIAYKIREEEIYLLVFHSHNGILDEKEEFVFSYIDNFLEQFFVQYYSDNNIPKNIIARDFPNKISDFLEKVSKKKVNLIVPKIGEKKQLLLLAEKNVELVFFSEEERLEDLKEKLKLASIPRVIECFDVSHLSGTSTVASMVHFKNGKPDKNNYRRFKIQTVEGIDDYSSIKEVVYRRYNRLIKEKRQMPDLIVIDGGKGQLSYAVDALIKLSLRIPIIGIAKRDEEIFAPGIKQALNIPKKSKAMMILKYVRDEAHRFAISYNKLLRSKKIKEDFDEV
jgi:excinuclease ABC subunit C